MAEAQTVGARIIGRYALYAQIASGGMASVHLGRLLGQAGFSRTVAIKRLHTHLAQDPEFVSMLLDEARLAARIRHPNVVATLDVVALDHELLVVMEYVHGEALSRVLSKLRKTNGHIPPAMASAIMCGVLYGLHAAHEAKSETGEPLGIIHRDVSPQNVMVGADGVPRVVDFGVAKAAGRLQETREGQLKGKIRYMAPEQLKRGEIGREADIYAASVVLWECLTGRRLFDDENEWQIAHSIVEGCSQKPSEIAKEVPAALDAVVMKGLSTKARERYKTAFEMAAALEDAVPPATPRQLARWLEEVAAEGIKARAAQLAEVEGQSRDLTTPIDAEMPSSPSASGSWPRASGEDFVQALRASGADLGTATATAPAPTDLSNLTTAQYDGTPSAPNPVRASVAELSEPSNTELGAAKSLLPELRKNDNLRWTLLAAGGGGLIVVAILIAVFSGGEKQATGAPSPSAAATTSAAPTAAPTQSEPEPEATESAATPEVSAEPVASAAPEPSASAAPEPKKKPVWQGSGTKIISKPVAGSGKVPPAKCNPPYYFDQDGVKHFKPDCL
jgi:serine/threonine protein kinase